MSWHAVRDHSRRARVVEDPPLTLKLDPVGACRIMGGTAWRLPSVRALQDGFFFTHGYREVTSFPHCGRRLGGSFAAFRRETARPMMAGSSPVPARPENRSSSIAGSNGVPWTTTAAYLRRRTAPTVYGDLESISAINDFYILVVLRLNHFSYE
ncbi:hypothetical protein PCASD_24842 [Puccinia coronata f. sp. avenae]|uniref:Uncharacterized protein n=1 Tax=Puccinia coronata f. sp. avenae TaxID=200324 RepID=A0A2N5S8G0_9BASI|nr:hypothetical protein PCASD_24842 [Puccinia coronata f. sp. avenae]